LWHITDRLGLTLGGRYSHDAKWANQSGSNTNPGLPLIAVPFATTNHLSSSSFDPRVVVDYKLTRDARIYAGYSTGYKGGGFQYIPSRWRWPTPPSGRNTLPPTKPVSKPTG
jgi:iron complex outermembrane receptor protein